MPRKQLTIKLGKGLNLDQLPSELAPGYWSDCQNMRFPDGFDQRVGGIAAAFTTPTAAPYGLQCFNVGTTNDIKRYLLQLGLAKAFVDDGTTRTEVTPGTDRFISALSITANVVTVTTTLPHTYTTGNSVFVYGSSHAVVNANGPYTITVTGASSLTFPLVTADSTATFGGVVSKVAVRGDFASVTADDKWTGGILGSIAIVSNPIAGMYYWAGSTSTPLRRLVKSSSSSLAEGFVYTQAARVYREYLIMLGANATTAATGAALAKKPYRITWAASVDPGAVPIYNQFDPAASNDAGFVDKTRGALVDGLTFGETFYVYQDQAILAMDWIGGVDVFSFRYLPGSDGLLAANCVVNTPRGQVFLSQNFDVKMHQGGEASSIAEGRVWNWLKSNIDSTNYKRAFLAVNKRFSEVWVCIPTTGNSTCNKALVWNWKSDTWGSRDLSGVVSAASGMLPTTVATDERLVIGTTTPQLGLVDSGTTDFGATVTSMVERTGISLDDPETIKVLQGTRWQDDGTAAATSSVYHGSAMTADGAVTYASAATATLGTSNWVNQIVTTGGRYMAVKRTTTAEIGKCRSLDMDFTTAGRF